MFSDIIRPVDREHLFNRKKGTADDAVKLLFLSDVFRSSPVDVPW